MTISSGSLLLRDFRKEPVIMIKSKESYPQTGGCIIDANFRGKGLFQGDLIIEERLLGRHLLQWHIIRHTFL